MAITLRQIITRTRVHLDDLTATRYKDEAIIQSINAILGRLWDRIKMVNPDWAQASVVLATVINQDYITTGFPTDYGEYVRLEYSSDKTPLDPWDWPYEGALTTTGKPWEFRVEAGKIVFERKADAVYNLTFWYEKRVPKLDLANENTAHGLPDQFDELIPAKTALRLSSRALLNAEEVQAEENDLIAAMTRPRTSVHGYSETRRQR